MLKKYLIAGNWKMNEPPVGCFSQGSSYRPRPDTDVWVFPSFIDLHSARDHGIVTGAQYGHPDDSGARTGDVSMKMLANQRYHAVLCGHSERREHHHESDEFVALQVASALKNGLVPVLCIGETADERELGQTEKVIERQLKAVTLAPQVIVAYEPVWAIGSGRSATPADAQKMHVFIRALLPDKKMRILYGGSMNAKNCEDLLKQPDIDGGLVGGASLKPDEFRVIVETAARLAAA